MVSPPLEMLVLVKDLTPSLHHTHPEAGCLPSVHSLYLLVTSPGL